MGIKGEKYLGPELVSICVFTPHGKTFTFKKASIVQDNETVLIFDYCAMSDGKMKRHTMLKANVVGWSVMP